ncbi:MAG: hypothetical protein WCX65_00615 [bacterium]
MKQIPNPRKTFGVIFIAMFLSCALYAFLGNVIAGHRVPAEGNGVETIKLIFSIAAAGAFLFGLQWPRFALTEEKLRSKGNRAEAMKLVQKTAINSLACIESVAIFGLMWSFIASEVKQLPYSSGFAMLTMLYLRMQINGYFDKVESLFPMDK